MHDLIWDFCSSDQRFAHELVCSSHPASFRFHLTMDTLAFGYILPTTGRIRDFNPLGTCAARRTIRTPVKQYAHTGSIEIRTPMRRNLHFNDLRINDRFRIINPVLFHLFTRVLITMHGNIVLLFVLMNIISKLRIHKFFFDISTTVFHVFYPQKFFIASVTK